MEGHGKKQTFFPDRSPTVHVGKLPINPPNFMGREDTDRGHGYTHTKHAWRSQDQTRPNPFQNQLPKNLSQEWGLQAQRNPPDARKSRTKSPFATQRPDTHFPIMDRQWIPKDTAFGTQESNSPFKDRPVVLLTRSAFPNPSAEAWEPPASEPGSVAVRRPTPAYSTSDVRHKRAR